MLVGGLNLVRAAIAKEFPIPEGMGNKGFAEYVCPVTLEGDGRRCDLQSDPLIAVSRENTIVCRQVAKPQKQGTIKENWAVGDWGINISGVIICKTKEELTSAIKELQEICSLREAVGITCPPVNEQYDVTRIAIKGLEFPFTPGELNQQFTITALSDSSYELLEEA